MTRWVVQKNLGSNDNIAKMAAFLEVLGVQFQGIEVIPFEEGPIEGVDEDPDNQPTIFYGSVGLIRRVVEQNKWKPGVFFNSKLFSFESLLNGFGTNLLNADSLVLTVQEMLHTKLPDVFFCRPTENDKTFTGCLMTSEEVNEWASQVTDHSRLQLNTRVQVSSPKVIIRETRHFVVDGKISTSSNYGHNLMKQDVVPSDVEFAEKMVRLYQPASVFALDTCCLEDGSMKVVETNCFNSSGLYWCDVYKLIKDVNMFVEETY